MVILYALVIWEKKLVLNYELLHLLHLLLQLLPTLLIWYSNIVDFITFCLLNINNKYE